MKKRLFYTLLTVHMISSISFGQFLSEEPDVFPGAEKLIVWNYGGCCSGKGYRTVFYFDKNGRTIKSESYYKRKLLASYKYDYYTNGLLQYKIETFNINDKNRQDTSRLNYAYDNSGRLISKEERFGRWTKSEKYSDFDEMNNPETIVHIFDNDSFLEKRKFDLQGRVIENKCLKKDSITYLEESKYNSHGDKVYSNVPTLLDKETGKMVVLLGGNRYAIVELYEYNYDTRNRWTEKFAIYDNRRILLEKRVFK